MMMNSKGKYEMRKINPEDIGRNRRKRVRVKRSKQKTTQQILDDLPFNHSWKSPGA
jgi:isopropylmalate/homocitrate/citramalate synthase